MTEKNEAGEKLRECPQRNETDCLVCCISMVTGIPYEEIPDFCGLYESQWAVECEKWLSPRGFGMIVFGDVPPYVAPWIPIIAQVPTNRGKHYHFVVVTADKIIDPSPLKPKILNPINRYAIVRQPHRPPPKELREWPKLEALIDEAEHIFKYLDQGVYEIGMRHDLDKAISDARSEAEMIKGQSADWPRIVAENISLKARKADVPEAVKLALEALNRFCDPAQFATIPGIGDPHKWLFHYQEDEFPWLLAQKAFDALSAARAEARHPSPTQGDESLAQNSPDADFSKEPWITAAIIAAQYRTWMRMHEIQDAVVCGVHIKGAPEPFPVTSPATQGDEPQWKVEHDGPSRPIILHGKDMYSISKFYCAEWGTFQDEDELCQKIVTALNAHHPPSQSLAGVARKASVEIEDGLENPHGVLWRDEVEGFPLNRGEMIQHAILRHLEGQVEERP